MGVDDKELVILGGHGSKFRCIVTGSRCIKYYKGLSKYDKATVQSILIQVNGVFPHYGGMKRFKLFQDEVWEIKDIGSQIRIACFWRDRLLICFYGIKKKDEKWPKQEKDNAMEVYKRIRNNY